MNKKWFILWGITLAILGLSLAGSLALEHRAANAGDGFSCSGVTQIPEKECEALAALYASTAGDSWTNNSGWLKNDEPCRWKGIICESESVDGQWSVTRLHLEDNNLKGSLPAELGNLQNLRHLDLSRNKLVDSIPPELGDLAKLQHLNLTDNRLTGDIPPELGNLAKLHFLWLTNNLLGGAIPTDLGKLESLLSLYLDGNDLAGGLPAELGDLSTVRRIFLDHNVRLAGSLPLTLSRLDDVEYFWFHDTSLCIPDDQQLTAWLTSIDHLRTSGTACADSNPTTLVITKTVVGEAPDTDWSFSGSGAIGDFSLDAAGGTITYTVPAGTYTLSETVQSGYAVEVACTDGQSSSSSINIDLIAGAKTSCTFTNTAQPARLTVAKKVSGPEPDADWEFSGSEEVGDFSLPAAGGSEVFTLTAGTHSITETEQDDYSATVACTNGSTGTSAVSLDLRPGDNISCTFINTCTCTAAPGTLVITKTVVGRVPNSGWSFKGTGSIGPFTMPAKGGATAFLLEAGVYTVTETVAEGYTPSVNCTDGSTGSAAATITLAPGVTAGCTFINMAADTPDTGSVQGIVFEDVNGSNQPDTGEGIANAMVTMTSATQPAPIAGAVTSASTFTHTTWTGVGGAYHFDDVPVGDYIIAVSPPAGYVEPESTTVTVRTGETATVEPIAAQKDIPNENSSAFLPIVQK